MNLVGDMGPGLGGIANDPMFQNAGGGPGPIRGLMPFRNNGMGPVMMQHRNMYRHNRRANGTEIKCPECRKPTVVPPEGLPVNYRVQGRFLRAKWTQR